MSEASPGELGKCPSCGCSDVSGLMSAFWVTLDEDGNPVKSADVVESDSELTDMRRCASCMAEWSECADEDLIDAI